MKMYLDIETLPTNDAEIIKSLRDTITPPSNYSKPETIQKWMDENAERELDKVVHKTGLDGLYGRVACIAWAFDDADIASTGIEYSERECLVAINEAIDVNLDFGGSGTLQIVGHNVAGFDLQFLKHRFIIHGIKPHQKLQRAITAKPWDIEIQDTMLMWSTDREKRVSLDKLCRALGIAGKDDFDGSQVAEAWESGERQKVIDYCKDDVRRVREVYKRMAFIS